MARLPWWRVLLLLVAAVALVWWLKHRTRQGPYGSEVHVAAVAVAPVDGSPNRYRLALGDAAWEIPFGGEAGSEEEVARREAEVDRAFAELGEAARAFRREHAGFERAEILVAAKHRGAVPFALTARVLSMLFASGYEDVEFRGKEPTPGD